MECVKFQVNNHIDDQVPNRNTEMTLNPSSSHKVRNPDIEDDHEIKDDEEDKVFMKKLQHVIKSKDQGINQIIHHLIDKQEPDSIATAINDDQLSNKL